MHLPLLSVRNIAKSFGWHDIFHDVSFELAIGEKIALVGPNGVGKTTLLRIIAKQIPPSDGTITYHLKKMSCGFLPQKPELLNANTARFMLEKAAQSLGAAVRYNVGEALARFGFSGIEADIPLHKLSGGQKTRLALARIWLSLPDLLILDEPTNHLDQEGLAWLEEAIRQYPHTVLCVSHDRYFLDQVAQGILELSSDGIKSYKGNYSAYRRIKEDAFRQQLQVYKDEQKEIRRIETTIAQQMRWFQAAHHQAGTHDYYRARAKKMASRAKSTISRLERAKQKSVKKPRDEDHIQLDLATDKHSGNRIILADNLGKSYDSTLFSHANFSIQRHDKVGLIGANGVGKTTLISIMLGFTSPTHGSLWRSPSLHAGYLEQEMHGLESKQNLLESVLAAFPQQTVETQQRARSLLASFLFKAADINKPLGVLSYGEKQRVALIRLLIGNYNVLFLDEPTNHLDLPAREKLEEALVAYNGTLVLASHDRYLLQKVCTKILSFEAGTINCYPGRYDEYLQKQAISNDDRLLLEHRLAVLSGQLATCTDPDEKIILETEYIKIKRKLQ